MATDLKNMTTTTKIKLFGITVRESRGKAFLQHINADNSALADIPGLCMPAQLFHGVNGHALTEYTITGLRNVAVYMTPDRRTFLSDLSFPYCKKMTKGVVGASISHLLLYQQLVLDNDADAYLICEDDARLAVTPSEFAEFIGSLPPQFDCVHLNESVWYPMVHSKTVNDRYMTIRRQFFNNAASYILSKQGALKLLMHEQFNVCRPPDDRLSQAFVRRVIEVIAPYKPLMNVDFSLPNDVFPHPANPK
jgi:GR25 family glycosyltransferase involved in LPS biosynthesis